MPWRHMGYKCYGNGHWSLDNFDTQYSLETVTVHPSSLLWIQLPMVMLQSQRVTVFSTSRREWGLSYLIDKLQNYHGLAIKRNLCDIPAMINDIHESYFHLDDDHRFCPLDKDSWCKFNKDDSRHKPKIFPGEILDVLAQVYDRLSNPALLERLSRGDSEHQRSSP